MSAATPFTLITPFIVMTGLGPVIHEPMANPWMAGSSPAMTAQPLSESMT